MPADAAAALARRAQFKERAAAVVLRQPARPWGSEDWLAFYGEKAAIGEYDHKMPRQQAEEHAHKHCISEWLFRNPTGSKADDGCVICGDGDRVNDGLLPVGLGGGKERTWLHSNCIPVWRSARMDAAVEALMAMNIKEGPPSAGIDIAGVTVPAVETAAASTTGTDVGGFASRTADVTILTQGDEFDQLAGLLRSTGPCRRG